MIYAIRVSPVSPSQPPNGPGGAGGGDSPSPQSNPIPEDSEEVDFKHVLSEAAVVGVEVLHDEKGPGARAAKPMPSPPTMTPAQKEIHDLTHMPPHPGCSICRPTRTTNVAPQDIS